MSKFETTLRQIYQSILTPTHQKINITESKIKNISDIYSFIISSNKTNVNYSKIFKQKTNDEIFKEFNIITEELIAYNLSLINQILTCNNLDQITPFQLINNTNSMFQKIYGTKIVNKFPIYICKFNFAQPDFWIQILNEFNIEYENNEKEHFKQNFKNNTGLTIPIGNAIILCLNNQNNIENNTIYHELFHCLQIILDIKININKIDENLLTNIFQLGLSVNDVKYLINPKEFQTYIQIDFNNIIENIYLEFYYEKCSISLEQFKLNALLDLKNNINNIFHSTFYKKFLQAKSIKNKDNTPIKCFAMCLYLSDKSYLIEALKILNIN